MMSKHCFYAWVLLPCLALSAAVAQEAPALGGSVMPPGPQVGRVSSGFAPYPAPDSGYVTDTAGLLSADQEERIEQWLWRVESMTGVEIAVVTIGSVGDYPGAAGPSIEAFATGLFNRYRIGNLPENDGVLLVVARNDRKARIELGAGYNPSRDRDAAKIMNGAIVPRFKQGEYAGGITDGVRAIMLEFAGVRAGVNWKLIGLLTAIPVVGLIAFSLFRSGKRGWGWIAVGLLIVLVLSLFSVLLTLARHAPRGSSGSWSSGGFGGGFGGGSSGGGGATGSW
jgi:uncharacterized protein